MGLHCCKDGPVDSSLGMGQGATQGPHFDPLYTAAAQETAELTRGGPRGHHIIEQGHVPVCVWGQRKGALEIASPLAGAELGLLRCGPDAADHPAVEGNAGEVTQREANLLRLIEASPPLTPPVQGDGQDSLRGIVQHQVIGQQPGEQGSQQEVATIFQARNEPGIGGLIVTYDLQPIPRRWPALAATAERPWLCEWRGAELAAMGGLPEAGTTPVTEQGLCRAGLAAEQAVTQPVGAGAEDRTCFGEQAL